MVGFNLGETWVELETVEQSADLIAKCVRWIGLDWFHSNSWAMSLSRWLISNHLPNLHMAEFLDISSSLTLACSDPFFVAAINTQQFKLWDSGKNVKVWETSNGKTLSESQPLLFGGVNCPMYIFSCWELSVSPFSPQSKINFSWNSFFLQLWHFQNPLADMAYVMNEWGSM